ncbi:hypothetical protein J421_5309 (plasmid) [Gemmatirosa kalamazoonensis]|uniref:Uncharacterized protein n=1 Tax=Gemmatirosa kalamazoonensis TaxID=861299 RepID=W0RPB2_9BACT|nr:hypothetical protein [Gemmatirosa kalamazoonensis]AHG92844.1 hypothetical protein J421_5309 [Gemmatirosa kalamazoonensis]
MTESRLAELLGALVDGWCARRALEPLAVLLPAYLAFSGLTDAWLDLAQAVDDLRGLGPDALTDEERAVVSEARALIHQALKAAGITHP